MLRRLTPLATAALVVGIALTPAPAHAEARVSVANSGGDPRIDTSYATTLTVGGTGFQSIKGGHGGIYVFFGAVDAGWRPSQGGETGEDYFYVPDSETKANSGYQKYVAFPGSDTASSANGGTMSATGSWSTRLVVPSSTFQAYDRDDNVRTVDCTRVTCGIITVGAHGVTNQSNETFTPVTVGDLAGTGPSGATAAPSTESTDGGEVAATVPGATDGTTAPSGKAPVKRGKPKLVVDRASARAGNVLAFTATGLTPGRQVSVVFDDGASGAGAFLVGATGQVAGVVPLPVGTAPGTHELRLFGIDDPPAAKFAVLAADPSTGSEAAPQVVDQVAASTAAEDDIRPAVAFAAAAVLVLLLALARLGVRLREAHHAA